MPTDVMDVKQVADYLGIAQSTVYKKVEFRQIPFTKVGTLLRFPKWLIDRWLTKNAVHPDESLFQEFIQLKTRYHLEQFMLAKGLDINRMTDTQLQDALATAIEELKSETTEES
jgi:excisionase family DNA binding protein